MGKHKFTYANPDPDPPTILDFEIWEGPPPPVLVETLATYARPGVDGAGAQRLGKFASTATIALIEHFSDFATAELFMQQEYMFLPEVSPLTVTYNNIDYTTAPRSVQHLVANPRVEIRTNLLICGPGYAYPNGAAVRLIVDLTPVIYVPPP